MKTLENVDCFDNIRVNYLAEQINNSISTEKRREILNNKFYFHCDCIKCEDVESDQLKSSLICQKENCQGAVPSVIGKCIKCNSKVEDPNLIEKHEKLKIKIRSTLERDQRYSLARLLHIMDSKHRNEVMYSFMKDNELEKFKLLFDEIVTLFHPFDEDFMKILIVAQNLFEQTDKRYEKITEMVFENMQENMPNEVRMFEK